MYRAFAILILLAGCDTGAADPTNNIVGEICKNYVDDEGDGFVDCDDPDCFNAAICNQVNNVNNTNNVNNLNNFNNANNINNSNNSNLKIYQSGTRIKMKVGTTADGSQEFKNWYDTQLNIDCSFASDTSGIVRCLPRIIGNLYYSNSSCSSPILMLSCTPSSGAYASAASSTISQCQYGYTLSPYLLQQQYSGMIYIMGTSGCSEWTNSSTMPTIRLYSATPVNSSQFAEQTISIQ